MFTRGYGKMMHKKCSRVLFFFFLHNKVRILGEREVDSFFVVIDGEAVCAI